MSRSLFLFFLFTVYCVWDLLNFDLWLVVFHYFCYILSHHLLKHRLQPNSPSSTLEYHPHRRWCDIGPHLWNVVLLLFSLLFSSSSVLIFSLSSLLSSPIFLSLSFSFSFSFPYLPPFLPSFLPSFLLSFSLCFNSGVFQLTYL